MIGTLHGLPPKIAKSSLEIPIIHCNLYLPNTVVTTATMALFYVIQETY